MSTDSATDPTVLPSHEETEEEDLPGQIDSQRGRTAYSQAEKAHALFDDARGHVRGDDTYITELRQMAMRHVEDRHRQFMAEQSVVLRETDRNHILWTQIVGGIAAASQDTEAGGSDALTGREEALTSALSGQWQSLAEAIAGAVVKALATTPPVTTASGNPGV